jgi:Domain of unknown function (DUF4878)
MTRTLKFSALALFAVVVLWACGGANGPKQVGEKFLNAIASSDFETAKKYATKDAQASLDMMASMSGGEAKGEPAKIEIGEVKEEGDKATLSYKENGADKTLELVKEGSEWKANWSKGGGSNPVGDAIEGAVEGAVEAVDSAAGAATEQPAEEAPAGH